MEIEFGVFAALNLEGVPVIGLSLIYDTKSEINGLDCPMSDGVSISVEATSSVEPLVLVGRSLDHLREQLAHPVVQEKLQGLPCYHDNLYQDLRDYIDLVEEEMCVSPSPRVILCEMARFGGVDESVKDL